MSKLAEVSQAIALKLSEHNFAAGPLDCMPLAIAAVEALREPTDVAVLRGAEAGELYGNTDARSTWYAMLDEILDEPQTSSKPLPSLEGQGPEITQAQIEAMERGGK